MPNVSGSRVLQGALIELGLAAEPGPLTVNETSWPVQVGVEPKSPSNTITCKVFSSKEEGILQKTLERITKPIVDLRVRGRTYQEAEDKLLAVVNRLCLVKPTDNLQFTPPGTEVLVWLRNIVVRRDLMHIGQTEANQQVFNAELQLTFTEVDS